VLASASPTLSLARGLRRGAPWLAAAAALVVGLLAPRGDVARTRRELDAARADAVGARAQARGLEQELQRARQELAAAGPTAPDPDAVRRAGTLAAELVRARAELGALQRRVEEAERGRLTAAALTAEVERVRQDLASARQRLAREDAVPQLLARADSRVTPLDGLAAAPRARGRVVWSPGAREAVLVAAGLEPAPAGKAYEVWVIAQGAPVPAGVFQVDAQGGAVVRLPALDETARAKTFAVTLEPAEGTPSPTGPMVLAGNVS
jgi:anti-sigma-K factor RskA